MRIPVAGINNEALVDEATDARDLLTDPAGNSPDFDGDGRVFEMQSLVVSNEHATQVAVLEVWDANEAAAPSAAVQRLTVMVGPTNTVALSWPRGAGPKFSIGCVGSIDAGTGTVNIGAVHVAGELI